MDFGEMSDVLNGWLNSSTLTKAGPDWEVEELQQLQALLYLARESQFDGIYRRTTDNRRLRYDAKVPSTFGRRLAQGLRENWSRLNLAAAAHPDPRVRGVRRDGHCHEAVMW